MPAKSSRGPWLWPLLLTAFGIVLLLNNFLLLGDFNATSLWPLALVILGAVILLRGDLLAGGDGRTFGITRGSVESATLEISAGEVDVQMRALQQEGRLIAGQYALSARPVMRVSDTHTHLSMHRAATPWYSLSSWEMGLARDLPWQVFISTSLGQVNLDLADVIVSEAVIATGIGDIRVIAPHEALGNLQIRSTLGNIHLITPLGNYSRIRVQQGRFMSIHADENRYTQSEPNVFISLDAAGNAPLVEISVTGTFGDLYLT